MRRILPRLALLFAVSLPFLAACDGCGGPPASPDGGSGGGDGGPIGAGDGGGDTLADGGDTIPDDGGNTSADGGASTSDGGTSTSDGGTSTSDGGMSMTDGGNPFEEPLESFCAGTGAPVLVGEGDACAGEIAENTFRFALCACSGVDLGGSLVVDSFDSSQGAYGAAIADGGVNTGSDGQLGSNAALLLNRSATVRGSVFSGSSVDIRSNTNISGNLYANGPALGDNSTGVTIGRNAYINGDVHDGYSVEGTLYVPNTATVSGSATTTERQAIPEVMPCACGIDEILDVAGLTAYGATHNDNASLTESTDGGPAPFPGFAADAWADPLIPGPATIELPCGRYYLTGVNQGQHINVHATGRVVLFVDGPFIASGVDIQVDEGAEIDLFIAGDLSIGSAASFGSAAQPAAVRTYVAGNVNLEASATFAGNVYAPNAHVYTNGAATVYGSLFVDSVEFNASAQLHFDTAIRRAGRACEPPAPEPDGGVPGDGGAPGNDAGGTPGNDAGGTTGNDAGGTTGNDAGTPGNDAGTPGNDAGTPIGECSDRCDPICGTDACLIDPDTGLGQCAPCSTDLDCCFPALCISGQCVFISG